MQYPQRLSVLFNDAANYWHYVTSKHRYNGTSKNIKIVVKLAFTIM
jgi:hypothetical protein